MNIGLIGCGRVGVSIFNLIKNTHRITGIYDINARRANQAARLFGLKKSTLPRLCQQSEAIFIATPDDEIQKVYKKIRPLLKKTKYLFHFSGIMGSNIFGHRRAAYCASAHPFATFPHVTVKNPPTPYYLFCEGDRQALSALSRIFPKRFFRIIKIDLKSKILHHLSGVFASNMLIGLYLVASDCANLAWPKKNKDDLIIKIMLQTLMNINKTGAQKALSGPLVRGDYRVILEHLKALKTNKEAGQAYRALSKILLTSLPKTAKYRRIGEILKTEAK